jgi:hypothetical protein
MALAAARRRKTISGGMALRQLALAQLAAWPGGGHRAISPRAGGSHQQRSGGAAAASQLNHRIA